MAVNRTWSVSVTVPTLNFQKLKSSISIIGGKAHEWLLSRFCIEGQSGALGKDMDSGLHLPALYLLVNC